MPSNFEDLKPGLFLSTNKGRTRFLSKEELQALLQACKEHKNRNLYSMVLMAASLGLRYGEVAALKQKNLDFEHRFITLEITKNQDVRVLPMPVHIYENRLKERVLKSFSKIFGNRSIFNFSRAA